MGRSLNELRLLRRPDIGSQKDRLARSAHAQGATTCIRLEGGVTNGEDLRITSEVPTGGALRVLVSYYTIES